MFSGSKNVMSHSVGFSDYFEVTGTVLLLDVYDLAKVTQIPCSFFKIGTSLTSKDCGVVYTTMISVVRLHRGNSQCLIIFCP